MNVVASSLHMRVYDAREGRKKLLQSAEILGRGEILADRFEIPQRCINSVVTRRLARIRKIVREHSRVHQLGKSQQNLAGNLGAASGKRKTRQHDHRVASPVTKPMVACDYRFSVWLARHRPLDEKLICGENQLLKPRR